MRFHFWGTRGSLPVALTADEVGARVVAALCGTIGRDLMPIEEVQQYVDNLDLDVRGTFGGHTYCVEIDRFVCSDARRSRNRAGSWPTRDDSRRLRARKRHCMRPLLTTVSKSHFDRAADS